MYMRKKINKTILMTVLVWAADYPYGVRSIDNVSSSRPNLSSYPPATTQAEAGNVSQINLTAISTTKAWQGYFGEITGVLTLEDSDGYVFYNWSTNEPKGEIYAAINNSINWSEVTCFEHNGSEGNFDVDDAEDWFGIEADDEDGINETFPDNNNIAFSVGTINISLNTCPATNAYDVNGVATDGQFENVLLTDNDVLIFTTIIENNEADNSTDILGFDGNTHDFELLVAEDGHDGNEDNTTTYYFWAEIE